MDLAQRVQRLEDRAELIELAVAYCLSVDDRDTERLAGLFTEDGVFRHGDGTVDVCGRTEIAEFYRTRQRTMGVSIHSALGSVLHFLNNDHAEGTVQGSVQLEAGGRTVFGMLRYFDEYTKIDGRWLFAERNLCYWYQVPQEDLGTVLAAPLRRWWPGEPVATVLPATIGTWQDFYSPD